FAGSRHGGQAEGHAGEQRVTAAVGRRLRSRRLLFRVSPRPSANQRVTFLPTEMPMIKKTRHITRNRKNRNLAMPAAAAAMPVNPNTAATSATTRKITAQRNII